MSRDGCDEAAGDPAGVGDDETVASGSDEVSVPSCGRPGGSPIGIGVGCALSVPFWDTSC